MSIEGRPVVVLGWQHDITGLTGYVVPLLLLDTNVEENAAVDRELTSDLYGGDNGTRLVSYLCRASAVSDSDQLGLHPRLNGSTN